ncbi:uncharacterized protein FOMMEDRAFT_151361 [Fomitiporia mediterranea MF3/22]|uniref:uncharacterized protein n=1 Tax=Fomitiporia mediterranea (strain MF3/22) TaxID=694068 RepID=UPI00044076DB|nr:uncharacterized protein FOMMEDRAFT_151361 [Fomitiporia mediterranea MF3/22]EJD08499.1 hypothetical protein FOMMEDRAFT_151361 [Fomitiporia mediterranea MF3/22]
MSVLPVASSQHLTSTSYFDFLPDELIDYICRHARAVPALPIYEKRSSWFWEPSSRYMLEMRFLPPTDHVALRLVSKRLNRIATPYIWETLDVQLSHQVEQASYLRAAKSRGALGWKRSRKSVHILDYVASHPDLASMVRILCLRVSGYTFTALARGEPENDLERCIERLLTATTGLTAFCIDKADLLTPLAVSRIKTYKTLRLLDLRTVGFRGAGLRLLSEEELPNVEWFGLSVFNLAYKSLKLPKNLKRVSLHCDSMSTFVRNEAVVLDSNISIGTIEELAIYDKHGDVALFMSRHFLNARARNQAVALKELFLDLEWCHTARLSEILSNFRGRELESLTIRNLHRMTPAGLMDIVAYFPNLRHLALSSSTTDIVAAWITGCFHDYVDALQGAKHLESLEWDNSALCYFGKGAEESTEGCRASVVGVVKLPSLKKLRLISFATCTVTTCAIRRKECGAYGGYDLHKSDIFVDFEASQQLIASLNNYLMLSVMTCRHGVDQGPAGRSEISPFREIKNTETAATAAADKSRGRHGGLRIDTAWYL